MHIYQLPGTFQSLDAETPALWEAGAQGLEEANGFVKAYFSQPVELPFAGEWVTLEDTDWLEKWKAGLDPVTIGRITVVPSWKQAEVPDSQIKLVIDPGMAFGTGHHATTQFGIEALQRLELSGKRVLDVGAGTGLLAMVAAKLGAKAYGVDLDPSPCRLREKTPNSTVSSWNFLKACSRTYFTSPPSMCWCATYLPSYTCSSCRSTPRR